MLGGILGGIMKGGILGDIFGGDPMQNSRRKYAKDLEKAGEYGKPFYEAGMEAIPQYQEWLNTMQNPQEYVNSLMGGYSQSPYATYMQGMARNQATNMGSATGMAGSSALEREMQQNASNIASGDLQNYLGNIFGVNQMYGQGLGNQMGMGSNMANSLMSLFGGGAENIAGLRAQGDMYQAMAPMRWMSMMGSALGGMGGGGMGMR